MSETTDRNDPRLGHGPNEEPSGQNAAYLVLLHDLSDAPPGRLERRVRVAGRNQGRDLMVEQARAN
jgi:hypothetical protein